MIQILLFFCYSFLGWCCECVYCSIPAKKFINRGFLEGPYCPIYGVGALLVISLLLPYKQHPVTLFIGRYHTSNNTGIYYQLVNGDYVSYTLVGLFKLSIQH